MKKLRFTFAVFIIALAAACQKDEITPPNVALEQDLTGCRYCGGSWDIIDTLSN